MIHRQKSQSGFTLIELLVVIAIVGLLSSIVLTSLSTVRKKARDTKRIADLRQINSAMELYIDENGHAPYLGEDYRCFSPGNEAKGECAKVYDNDKTMWAALLTDLGPYLNKLPKDPCADGCGGGFYYVYHPPSVVHERCKNSKFCSLTEDQENQQYSIFAHNMEVDSSSYVTTNDEGKVTFGFLAHQVNDGQF